MKNQKYPFYRLQLLVKIIIVPKALQAEEMINIFECQAYKWLFNNKFSMVLFW